MKKLLKTIFILLSFYILLSPAINSYAFELNNNQVVGSSKVWNVQFSKELKYDSSLKNSITVVDVNGKTVAVTIELGKDMQSILVKPPLNGYDLGKVYTLKIDTNIYSKDDMKLKAPVEINFKINNTLLVESNENIKIIFNDGCNTLINNGWNKSVGFTQDSFISDFNDNDKYNIHTPYGQYLFYNTSLNSITKISKAAEIGAGPFNIEFDAKIEDLQTPSSSGGWRGFIVDLFANNKRYRLSFNSKTSDNSIKINLLNKASGDGSFQTADVNLPKDNNIHRWSIKNNGNKIISVLLDGSTIATFNDPQLESTGISDMVVLYSDMTGAVSGMNKIYIENFAVVKSLAIKDYTVTTDESNRSVSANLSITMEDEKLITDTHYKVKCALYKNDKMVAEQILTLDKKNLSFTLNNITQSGEMKLITTIIAADKKIEEVSKTVSIDVSTMDLQPGESISSTAGEVYLFSQMDKMQGNTLGNAEASGWTVGPYKDYESNRNGTIIENKENSSAVSMPVKLNGWFRVYVGYVTGTESFKISETKGSSSMQINSDISLGSNELYGDQWIFEKSTIISNFNNSSIEISPILNKKARIAYIKLIGLTQEQIAIYEQQNQNKKTVLYDFDGYSAFFDGMYPSVEALKSNAVDKLVGKNIGELNWCLGTTGMLNYNSKYAGNAFEGLEEFDDQLRDGDVLAKYQILNILSSGKSPLEIVAERSRDFGLKVNASLRMDTFYSPQIYGFLNGAMYNDYKQFIQPGSYALDYYYPEVRTYIKNVLLEAASVSNVAGITLDFCRYPTIFAENHSNEEKVLIMNEFLRDLRSELPKDKTITIRVPYSEPLKYGFDINTWIKEGLLNRLVPSSISREEFFNIKPYVDMVKNTNVQLYVGISADVSGHDITKQEEELVKQGLYIHNKVYLDVQQYLLRAYESYKAGADGVFLFNSSSSLYLDANSPIQSTFMGEKAQIEKWHEFDYVSSFMVNKINVPVPSI